MSPVCWGSEARLEDHSTSQHVFPPSCSLECKAWGPDDGSPEWMDSLWGLSSPILCQAACEGGAPPLRGTSPGMWESVPLCVLLSTCSWQQVRPWWTERGLAKGRVLSGLIRPGAGRVCTQVSHTRECHVTLGSSTLARSGWPHSFQLPLSQGHIFPSDRQRQFGGPMCLYKPVGSKRLPRISSKSAFQSLGEGSRRDQCHDVLGERERRVKLMATPGPQGPCQAAVLSPRIPSLLTALYTVVWSC